MIEIRTLHASSGTADADGRVVLPLPDCFRLRAVSGKYGPEPLRGDADCLLTVAFEYAGPDKPPYRMLALQILPWRPENHYRWSPIELPSGLYHLASIVVPILSEDPVRLDTVLWHVYEESSSDKKEG